MKNIIIAIVAIAIGIGALWYGVQYRDRITQEPVAQPDTSTSTTADASSTVSSTLPTIPGVVTKITHITMTKPDGLKIEDIKTGTGAVAKAGTKVSVHYVGTLTNGTKFDSSRDRGAPFSFNLGAGEVIKGWDEGVAGMQVGGVRKLTIPPSLGYGATAQGPIPANSTLIFEVELLGVNAQ